MAAGLGTRTPPSAHHHTPFSPPRSTGLTVAWRPYVEELTPETMQRALDEGDQELLVEFYGARRVTLFLSAGSTFLTLAVRVQLRALPGVRGSL